MLHKLNHCVLCQLALSQSCTAGLPEFMRWKKLAWHLYIQSSNVLLNFCLWVEGEIEELEEAGPLSAQHKKIKRLVKERAAQHDRNEQLFTKNSVIAIFRHEDQTRGLKSQIWNV